MTSKANTLKLLEKVLENKEDNEVDMRDLDILDARQFEKPHSSCHIPHVAAPSSQILASSQIAADEAFVSFVNELREESAGHQFHTTARNPANNAFVLASAPSEVSLDSNEEHSVEAGALQLHETSAATKNHGFQFYKPLTQKVVDYDKEAKNFQNNGLNLSQALLKKAVDCDKEGRALEASSLYVKGVEVLSDIPAVHQQKVKTRIMDYLHRSEHLFSKMAYEDGNARHIRTINLKRNTKGKNYEKLFHKYLNKKVVEALIIEPELSQQHYLQDLIGIFETLVKLCPKLSYVKLITKKADGACCSRQEKVFRALSNSLADVNVKLRIAFLPGLEIGKIVLSNGYIIKSDRGIHLFKHPINDSILGKDNCKIRKCLASRIDIFKMADMQK